MKYKFWLQEVYLFGIKNNFQFKISNGEYLDKYHFIKYASFYYKPIRRIENV